LAAAEPAGSCPHGSCWQGLRTQWAMHSVSMPYRRIVHLSLTLAAARCSRPAVCIIAAASEGWGCVSMQDEVIFGIASYTAGPRAGHAGSSWSRRQVRHGRVSAPPRSRWRRPLVSRAWSLQDLAAGCWAEACVFGATVVGCWGRPQQDVVKRWRASCTASVGRSHRRCNSAVRDYWGDGSEPCCVRAVC
jgi:hypothetical protein